MDLVVVLYYIASGFCTSGFKAVEAYNPKAVILVGNLNVMLGNPRAIKSLLHSSKSTDTSHKFYAKVLD